MEEVKDHEEEVEDHEEEEEAEEQEVEELPFVAGAVSQELKQEIMPG